jgi:NNP family nitrate/nitrite transporter-like MFS transporter
MKDAPNQSFLSQIGPILFLAGIFLLNFLARIILSPLLPTVERDLKIGHGEAGSLFLFISLGNCLGLLGSGLASSCLRHRKTILLSSVAVGGALIFVSLNHHLWGIRIGFILVGMASGLYLPSGIATITELVKPQHWGKAMAIHELAPNLGFVMAPLVAEALLGLFSWRGVLIVVGIGSILAGMLFAFFGKGGTFSGEPLNLRILRNILVERSLWIMIFLFTLGAGASSGIYAMIPLYLVSERGMEQAWANTLLALSRILTPGVALLTGWAIDRMGLKQTLKGVFSTMAITTVLLGIVPGSWIILIIFLQALFSTSFFPAGFTALSRISSAKTKHIVVSFTLLLTFIGVGVVPAGIGIMGEMGSFSLGIAALGGVTFVGLTLVRFLKFSDEPEISKNV